MNEGFALMRNAIAWCIPFAIVAVAIGYETRWGRDVDPDPAPAKAAAAQPVTVALLPEYRIEGGVEARKETVERELFNPTRRPAPPATQTAGGPSGPMPKGLYTLTGTTVVGNMATAFLREIKGGKSHTVRQGDTLDGTLISEVKPDHVRLSKNGDVEELQLKIASGPKSTIQIAPAAQAAQGQSGVRPAGAVPAGGTGVPSTRRYTPPVAPPPAPHNATNPAANAAQGTTANQGNGTISVSEILAERRRAARAAAAAANQGAQ
ncbi:MAG TPA: hypothetical protein VJ891_08365 [Casimicrobiaceae bacterium]|nr:hypothetical protein [Casimicrobiaceae bacterium]